MRRLLLLLTCVSVATLSHAQTLAEYMHLRRANGITQPTAVSALDTIVGSRVVEISTTVKGTFKVDTHGALMIDADNGVTDIVECGQIPDWLAGNEVKARLLVKVTRADETSEPTITLLAAAPEDQLAGHDSGSSREATSRFGRGSLPSRHATYRSRRNEALPQSSVTPIYAQRFREINPRLSEDDANAIAQLLIGYSLQYGVDARLIVAMVTTESHFNPEATSRHGAQGLGQLMPGTAQDLGVENAYDIEQNLDGMVRMVKGLLDTYKASRGDNERALELTVAAYNAGSGAVAKYGGVPPYAETQNYVRKVLGLYSELTSGDR